MKIINLDNARCMVDRRVEARFIMLIHKVIFNMGLRNKFLDFDNYILYIRFLHT